jgi:hypothetical protein
MRVLYNNVIVEMMKSKELTSHQQSQQTKATPSAQKTKEQEFLQHKYKKKE